MIPAVSNTDTPSTPTSSQRGTPVSMIFDAVANFRTYRNATLRDPISIGPLIWFRLVYGITMVYWAVSYLAKDLVRIYYILPKYHFPWFPFGSPPPLPGEGMIYLFWILAALGVAVTLGVCYRITATLLGIGFTYVFLSDQAYYQNHYYLMAMTSLAMPFVAAHRRWSIDAWLRTHLRTNVVAGWQLFVIRFLIAIPYIYGGIAKITPDWLAGQPVRQMLKSRTWYPVLGQWFESEFMVQAFLWGGLLLDLSIVPMLLFRRTRILGLLLIFSFHVLNGTMLTIGVFPWFMIGATLVLLPAGTFDRFFNIGSITTTCHWRAPQRWVIGLITAFVVAQCLIPFRHHLYAGTVSWNEAGHYFSWRMKLRGKTCVMRIIAYDPKSKTAQDIDPSVWLTSFQANRMARNPMMIRDFCRFVHAEFDRAGVPDVEMHAIVLCSLNGRKPQLFLDPEVDLATEANDWGAPNFVVPLREPLRRDAWNEPRRNWVQHLPQRYRYSTPSRPGG